MVSDWIYIVVNTGGYGLAIVVRIQTLGGTNLNSAAKNFVVRQLNGVQIYARSLTILVIIGHSRKL